MRTGTSFSRIETGRYEREFGPDRKFKKLPVKKIICRIYNEDEVEN